MWRPIVVALLIVVPVVMAQPRIVLACTCATFTSAEAYDWADHVFQGRVMEVETLQRNPYMPTRARLEINTVWKGEAVSEVFVEGGTGADCRVLWQQGETYIVFAQASNSGALRTYSCQGTGTGLVSYSPDPLAVYGAGTPVPEGAPVHDNVVDRSLRPPDAQTLSWITAVAAFAGVLLLVALMTRRRIQ